MTDIIITSPTTFFINRHLWSINRLIAIRETFGGDTSRYDTRISYADQIHQASDLRNPKNPAYLLLTPILMNTACRTIQRLIPEKGDGISVTDYYDWADNFIKHNGVVFDKRISDLILSSNITIWSILETWDQVQYPILRDPSSYVLLQVTADEDTVMLAKLSFDSITVDLGE